MTKTLTKHLQAIKDSKRGIFVPYIMAGDHAKGLDGLFETIALLENSGVSAIEVGIPWSDPVADGPVIELAGQRSLAKDVTLTAIIKKLQEQKTQVYRRPLQGRRRIRRKADHRLRCSRPYRLEGQPENPAGTAGAAG